MEVRFVAQSSAPLMIVSFGILLDSLSWSWDGSFFVLIHMTWLACCAPGATPQVEPLKRARLEPNCADGRFRLSARAAARGLRSRRPSGP